jgi:hypothetical protein
MDNSFKELSSSLALIIVEGHQEHQEQLGNAQALDLPQIPFRRSCLNHCCRTSMPASSSTSS